MGKWVHRLSNIDATARTGHCTICGPVKVRRKQDGWRCAISEKRWQPGYSKTNNRRLRHLLFDPSAPCSRCGFTPLHPRQMDLHHRDRNRQNNDETNLELLCANCHRLEHAFDPSL